jgi:hypothetical protein
MELAQLTWRNKNARKPLLPGNRFPGNGLPN